MTIYSRKITILSGGSFRGNQGKRFEKMESEYGVNISYEKIENREMRSGLFMERTLDKSIKDMSQEVITLSSDKEDSFSNCIVALYEKI